MADILETYYSLVDYYKYELSPRRVIFSGKTYRRIVGPVNLLLSLGIVFLLMNTFYLKWINPLNGIIIYSITLLVYFFGVLNVFANCKAKKILKINIRKRIFDYWFDYEFELYQLRLLKNKLIELEVYNTESIIEIIKIGLEKYKPLRFESLMNKAIIGALILPIWIEFIKWLYSNLKLDSGTAFGLTFFLIFLILVLSFLFKIIYELIKHSFTDINSVQLTILLNKILQSESKSQ